MGLVETVQRVGLIGDVHTEHRRLAAAIEHLNGVGVDRLMCTGDLADGPGEGRDLDRCVELLDTHDVLTVGGNHDRWVRDRQMRDLPDATESDDIDAETGDYLDRLPQTIEFSTPAGLALLCHGLGTDDMAKVIPLDRGVALDSNAALQALLSDGRYRYVLNGHSHKRMVRTIGGLTIINAGTLLTGRSPCCVLVDFAARQVDAFDLEGDTPAALDSQPLD